MNSVNIIETNPNYYVMHGGARRGDGARGASAAGTRSRGAGAEGTRPRGAGAAGERSPRGAATRGADARPRGASAAPREGNAVNEEPAANSTPNQPAASATPSLPPNTVSYTPAELVAALEANQLEQTNNKIRDNISRVQALSLAKHVRDEAREELIKLCDRNSTNELCKTSMDIIYPKGPIGCYSDSYQRHLPILVANNDKALTVEKCNALCVAKGGMAYAGTQYAGYCFCGTEDDFSKNTLTSYSRRPDSECNTPCTGNKSQDCGGGWRNSIVRL